MTATVTFVFCQSKRSHSDWNRPEPEEYAKGKREEIRTRADSTKADIAKEIDRD